MPQIPGALQVPLADKLKWPRHWWLLAIKSGKKMLFTNKTTHILGDLY